MISFSRAIKLQTNSNSISLFFFFMQLQEQVINRGRIVDMLQ